MGVNPFSFGMDPDKGADPGVFSLSYKLWDWFSSPFPPKKCADFEVNNVRRRLLSMLLCCWALVVVPFF